MFVSSHLVFSSFHGNVKNVHTYLHVHTYFMYFSIHFISKTQTNSNIIFLKNILICSGYFPEFDSV